MVIMNRLRTSSRCCIERRRKRTDNNFWFVLLLLAVTCSLLTPSAVTAFVVVKNKNVGARTAARTQRYVSSIERTTTTEVELDDESAADADVDYDYIMQTEDYSILRQSHHIEPSKSRLHDLMLEHEAAVDELQLYMATAADETHNEQQAANSNRYQEKFFAEEWHHEGEGRTATKTMEELVDKLLLDDENNEQEEEEEEVEKNILDAIIDKGDLKNLHIPQIHLPPRMIPNHARQAWQHHHRATVNLVKRRGQKRKREEQEEQRRSDEKDDDEEEGTTAATTIMEDEQQEPQQQQQQNPMSKIWQNLMNRPKLVSSCSEWKRLQKHAEHIQSLHLKEMLEDTDRCNSMYAVHDGVYLDYSRQRVTLDTMKFLYDLAEKQELKSKIDKMVTGEKINFTEDRAVLHTALRADRSEMGTIMVDDGNMDVVREVYDVLDQVKEFTDGVRSGQIRGYTGKRLRNIVSVGIGGSYLGPEFLHECLKTEPEGVNAALGYSLRFLSNVDPVDVERTCADLDPEETLIVIVSKTFTTAETMLNARTMRQWLWDFMGNDKDVVRKHMVACASTSATDKVKDFGIDPQTGLFRFWDFIGGRYSVCSAAGAVPISLLYGFDLFEKFLKGANSIDKHFVTAPFDQNIPVLMGLLGVWNMSFMNYLSRTTLPYAEALLKLPAHIQQLDMESNGKCMTKQGLEVDYPVGEIDFGEAGTNGQHSFYQLLHMGQTVPCDFIGFVQSQHDFCVDDENLSSHDELMANFFAQPDALATGKTADEVRAEGVPEELVPHKVFKGNRPSLSLLLPKLTAYACGQLLAIYEHRTAVQGFIWDINSFDQWGVELGKKLAIDVKDHVMEARQKSALGEDHTVDTGRPATTRLLNYYLDNSRENNCCQGSTPGPDNSYTQVTRKTHRDHHPPQIHDLGGCEGRLS